MSYYAILNDRPFEIGVPVVSVMRFRTIDEARSYGIEWASETGALCMTVCESAQPATHLLSDGNVYPILQPAKRSVRIRTPTGRRVELRSVVKK